MGNNCWDLFKDEAGGHRFQRISPTERNGRVHTSTVTVAVLPEISTEELNLDDKDLEWNFCRGSGAGGQKRNKTESAVQLLYKPTNILIRVEDGRSQFHNREKALMLLRQKLWQERQNNQNQELNQARKQQIGSGMRGDKRRTIRFQDGIVKDHILNKKWQLKEYLSGKW